MLQVERNAKCVAAKANEKVDLPAISESASFPSYIDTTSSGRAARKCQKYMEQIVAAAAVLRSKTNAVREIKKTNAEDGAN
jgi:hypothetical protein